MAKALFVTYLIGLCIALTSAYEQECAVGPEYWCKSFENAENCGALRHCTDTVWRYDEKHTKVQSTTTCQWCQKILENTHQSIQHLANNEDLIKSSLVKGCELFPLTAEQLKCKNALTNYGTSIASLMKNKRYVTLCNLMNICSDELPVTEKPRLIGNHRCTWGPSFWCSSLSNSRECSSMDHCKNKVWSEQSIQKKPNDNICQYCEFTIEKLRVYIETNTTEISVEKFLTGACSMLKTQELIDECTESMSKYADEIVVLIRTNIDPGVICHLTHMCKEATVITRVKITEQEKPDVKNVITFDDEKLKEVDEESAMLCNVIVRATYELHTNQHKNQNEIQNFLKNDCQKLSTEELIQKCEDIVDRHGVDIHEHVTSNIELSKVCDYIDYSTHRSLPSVHCELCSFVLATAKYMIDAKQTEDKILNYIDEQVCSRLTGTAKKTCKHIIDSNGKDLIDSIQCGTRPMLLCTRFQVCVDQVISKASTITKEDRSSFIKENICDNLGSFKDACHALIEKDATRLMQTVVNDMEGDTLCSVFGLCPKKMSFLDNLSVNDDTNKCKRCVDDFTRRKHIAEKLVNHSAAFLHQLCKQIPQKDDCIKAVDESINELTTFIRSLNPQEICIQLKLCNETLLTKINPIEISSTDNIINLIKDSLNCTLCKLAFNTIKKALVSNSTEKEIIQYIKHEICSKLGGLAELCNKIMDEEGPAILAMISKDIDPKKACTVMGICSGSSTFENCNDKCECCMDKIEIHEVQVATFLRGMVESIKSLCQRMPGSAKCLEMTKKFDGNVNKITSNFNSKRVCQLLNHCSALPIEIPTLSQCESQITSKKEFLRSSISSINENLKSLCEYIPWNKDCYSIIDRSTLDITEKLQALNSNTVCTSGNSLDKLICSSNTPFDKLCKQLVESNEDNIRMEGLFKSMFNQNGHVEKDLCELDEKSIDCKTSLKLDNCKDKCDCCVQFYTTKKTYDLQMIESLRQGLLATCDWSLTKDYCISWFNRVCDRMKAKVDDFIPTNFCKRTGLCPMNEDCKINGDKCQCCTSRINSRQNRFRTIVNDVTTALLSSCTDENCRSLVTSTQQQTIDQINRINSQTICQRYAYCSNDHSSQASLSLTRLLVNTGSSIEGLDDRLETALASDVCFQYGQLRPMCEHLISSIQGQRYAYVYSALLKNNPKLIDDDLREQMATNVNADVCDSCKNAVQTSKDFWGNALESVRTVLLRTCERCPSKDQCRDFYNKRFDNIKSYLENIDPDQFCQNIHLCSKSVIIIKSDKCSMCIDRLQARKDGILHAIDRLASYFDDVCQRFGVKQCQVFIQQIQTSFKQSVESFDPKQTCTAIGFCSTNKNGVEMDFDTYEKYLINEIDKNICSTLGPFESLCKHVIQGNRKQIETVKINYNIKDLMKIGEERVNGMTKNFFNAANLNECDKDKCQCCIDGVNQKKDCLKNMGDKMIGIFSQACDYCPSKDQCRKYWQDYQTKFDSCIDDIDAKQVCTRLGFCSVSKLCANMGMYQQSCEEALTAFTQSVNEDRSTLERHLPHTSIVVLPTKTESKDLELIDSNSTCILCEYMMNILSNYIHQKSTEDEIEQGLQKVCNQMPATLQKQCHELIENYGPPIIAILIREFDVKTICRKLNLCTKEMKVEVNHITKSNVATCSICDYVSTYINFALKRDSSDKSLDHALATVCTHLSTEHKSPCETLVQLFRPNIRKLELQLGNNFCKQLTICQTTDDEIKNIIEPIPVETDEMKKDEELKRIITKNLDDTPQCMLCHYVVTYLDAVIKTNKSEAAIEAALKKVCTILPSKERAQCNEFVKTYGPVLAELISQMADPDTVCRYLGMCQVTLPKETSTPVTYSNHDYIRIPDGKEPPLTCTICQYIISRMKHYLELNQTEEEILASLKESCNLFSVLDLKQQCNKILDQYGPYLIQMVSSDIEPKVACQSLGMCQKQSQIPSSTRRQSTPPPAVSTSTKYGKCIYGMNYWCTSRQNAELCNAVELCERQVWSKKNKNIII